MSLLEGKGRMTVRGEKEDAAVFLDFLAQIRSGGKTSE